MADFTPVAGGVQHPSPALATADQSTILGSGTPQDPLRASGSTSGDLVATYVVTDGPAYVGEVVSLVGDTPAEGTAASVTSCNSGVGANPFGIGVVVAVRSPSVVVVRTAGLVELTTGEWDQATGGIGGLTPGAVYYSSFVAVGGITTTAPTQSNIAVAQVGVALRATTLLLSTPCAPRINP